MLRGIVRVEGLNINTLKEYTPLNLNALERFDSLLNWIKSWIRKEHYFLIPENWFIEACDLCFLIKKNMYIESLTYVWTPALYIADVAL